MLTYYRMDNIELAPKRQSFKQGCHVKTVANVAEKHAMDKAKRLTGRSTFQRRAMETNFKDGDSISAASQEFECFRKNDFQMRNRSSSNDHAFDRYSKHVSHLAAK